MKKITAKVITISSQVLIVGLFLLSLFAGKGSNGNEVVIGNDNFNKMADKTSSLFKKESLLIDSELDEEVVTPLYSGEEEKDDNKEISEDAEVVNNNSEVPIVQEKVPTSEIFADNSVIETYTGNLTSYGADCYGCSGFTYSGHDLRASMYYDDYEYGTIRILAADPQFPMYSIFRVNVPGKDPFIGIVLDRGGNVGFGRGTLFDLAFFSESDPNLIPLTRNVTFEYLRSGK